MRMTKMALNTSTVELMHGVKVVGVGCSSNRLDLPRVPAFESYKSKADSCVAQVHFE